MPHCHPFKHGFYLTGAQPAPSFAEQAVRTPARAGMTWCRFPYGWIRHSRAGGNPDLRTTAIFKDYLKVRDSGFPLSRE
ncbi:hypothetical protein DD207_11860 [Neisseria gonorrhoeae]